MADRLGVDILAIDDLDPRFRLVGGAYNVGCAQARRLSISRGGLFYAPDYGRDLSAHLNETMSTRELQSVRKDAIDEMSKDERVRRAQVSATWDPTTKRIRVEVRGFTKAGEFKLVKSISDVTTSDLSSDK